MGQTLFSYSSHGWQWRSSPPPHPMLPHRNAKGSDSPPPRLHELISLRRDHRAFLMLPLSAEEKESTLLMELESTATPPPLSKCCSQKNGFSMRYCWQLSRIFLFFGKFCILLCCVSLCVNERQVLRLCFFSLRWQNTILERGVLFLSLT